MAEPATLHRYEKVLRGIALETALSEDGDLLKHATPITRDDTSEVSLAALRALFVEFESRRKTSWPNPSDRPKSDAWLAPRVHAALRLTRAQASDKGIWHWLAIAVAPDYLDWRWGSTGTINDQRWHGPIHKQALARLWWGAELLRDGADYEPVERAFVFQDLINSFLHRPLVRSRSFALGLVNALTEKGASEYSSRQVNDLARILNLCTAGRQPEAAVGFQQDDQEAARIWSATDATLEANWDGLPKGPEANDTTNESRRGGRALADHGMSLAGLTDTTASSADL